MNQYNDVPPRDPAHKPEKNPGWANKFLLYCKKHQANRRQYYSRVKIKATSVLQWIWWALNVDIVRDGSTTAICTILIVIATGVYSYFAYLQWDATRQAAEAAMNAVQIAHQTYFSGQQTSLQILAEMKKQSTAMQRAATAANSQATVSGENLEASNRQSKAALDASIATSRLEQRAWVAPLGISNISFKVGEPIVYSIVFQNSGKSPALHETHEITARSFPKGGKVDFIYTLPSGVMSSTTIQPGMNITNSPAPDILRPTQGQIDAIKSGDAVLYLYGKISYDDVFSIQHHTTFCFVVNPDLTSAEWCTEYNEAD